MLSNKVIDPAKLRAGVRVASRWLSEDGIVDGLHIRSVGQIGNSIDLSPFLPGVVECPFFCHQ